MRNCLWRDRGLKGPLITYPTLIAGPDIGILVKEQSPDIALGVDKGGAGASLTGYSGGLRYHIGKAAKNRNHPVSPQPSAIAGW